MLNCLYLTFGTVLLFSLVQNCSTQCPTGSTVARCDSYAFYVCQQQFNRETQLASDAYWHDPDLMRYGLENLYVRLKAIGLYSMCLSYSNFRRCLGGNVTCMDPQNLSCIEGIRLSKARNYLGVFEQVKFLCGGGLPLFLRNEECIANVFINSNSSFVACRDRLAASIATDPDGSCSYANDFIMDCYQSAFANACGAEGGWFGCEYARTEIIFVHRQCPLSCSAHPAVG